MRIRHDFVTNSSSASFVIDKRDLNEAQIHMIRNHIDIARKIEGFGWLEAWDIKETKRTISGDTIMDNFDMEEFLVNVVMVPRDKIKMEGSNYGYDD